MRDRHPKKEVETALQAAEAAEFKVVTGRGHWGLLQCPGKPRNHCKTMSINYTLTIRFRISGATEPDEYSVRAYEDERLQDIALMGPDHHGVFDAEFERQADSFPATVVSALRDLSAVFPEAEILEVEQDNLVSIAAIARRLDRSHESIRLYARGKRGPGNFPPAAGKLDAKTEVWRWPDVAIWWQETLGEPVEQLQEDLFLLVLNDALDMRRAAKHLEIDADQVTAIAEALPPELREAVSTAAVG